MSQARDIEAAAAYVRLYTKGAEWSKGLHRAGEHVIIEAAALSFLHHQVRSIVGCLAAVGRGRWTASDLQAALDAKDRAALAENAPPDGLYFMRALYP